MNTINETPIVDDETGKVINTSINPDWVHRFTVKTRHDKSKAKKAVKKINTIHRAFSKGNPDVPLSAAERVVRNIARGYQGGRGFKGANFPARKGDENIIKVESKNDMLDDKIILVMRKLRKEALQKATHSNNPNVVLDPKDSSISEEDKKEVKEIFPKVNDIPSLVKGLTSAQKAVWNRAMANKNAKGKWRSPEQARRIATRIADSIVFESEEEQAPKPFKRPDLIKAPKYASRRATTIRPIKRSSGLTGSDSYRPQSTHASLVKNQPWRMVEKLRGLLAMWRRKGGQARQVVKNIPVSAKFGTQTIKKMNAPKKEKDLKHNKK